MIYLIANVNSFRFADDFKVVFTSQLEIYKANGVFTIIAPIMVIITMTGGL